MYLDAYNTYTETCCEVISRQFSKNQDLHLVTERPLPLLKAVLIDINIFSNHITAQSVAQTDDISLWYSVRHDMGN
jgi:hypothetical protein